jgi:hypothetical protein
MVAVLAAPATTAVASPPAVDQYTSKFPGAGGNSGLASGSAPVARPWLLSARTRAALAGPDGQLLTLIATSPGLGAPRVVGGGETGATSGQGRALATAIADAAATGPGLALIGALATIAVAAVAARAIRRRRSSL